MGKFEISLRDGGLNRQAPSDFMKTGLVCGGVTADGLALNTVSAPLTKIEDVVALGIDADYDIDNEVLVYNHCKEFFRLCPSGTLYLMLVAQGVTLTQMATSTLAYAQKMIAEVGSLRRLGLVLNPADDYVPTLTTGLDADVHLAVAQAELTAIKAFNDKRPLQIVIEGREFNGTVALLTDQRLSDRKYAHVTLIQDPAVAALFTMAGKSAAVGTTLGAMAFVNPNESIGWTGKVQLSDANTGEFASVAFSSGALASTLEADFQNITDKGYIFGRTYASQSGVYFDDYSTCADITSDYAYGQEVAVILDASRRLYDQLFPRINGPVKLDPDTGQIAPEIAKAIEADGGSSLDIMVQSEWISGYDVFVDASQDVLTSGIVEVQFSLVAIATGRIIKASIGFTKKIA